MPVLIIGIMIALFTTQSFAIETSDLRQIHVTPAPSSQVLQNPGMGIYMQHPPMDSQPGEWFMQLSDIAYYRLDWSDVNPEPGIYTFDEYFQPMFDKWVTQCNKRVAFRVMCQNMHSNKKYVTPQWMFDAGVPGYPYSTIYTILHVA